jgi:SAM-dependent methyltransferase
MYMRLKKLILKDSHRKTPSKVSQNMFSRADKIRALIDPASQRGLEIGALNSPAIYSSEGKVYYVDHLPTDELKEKYSPDPNINIEDIVPVDYVWGDKTLVEAVGQGVYFDYLVASHVVEHVPDVIGWFGEISAVLKPGGVLSLVVPDKRFTFD